MFLLVISFFIALLAPANICLAQQSFDSVSTHQLDAIIVTAQSARQRLAKINLTPIKWP